MSSIEWQDEILEALYWMRGESIATEVSRDELAHFLAMQRAEIDEALHALEARRLVHVDGDRLTLSGDGVIEGKRRFLEEFGAVLGQESHIESDDADCECHQPGWEGICLNAR